MRAAAVLLALAAAALAGAEPALAGGALERARAALGDLEALRAFSYRSSGEVSVFDEGPTPGGPPTRAAQFTATVRHRVLTTDVRLDLVRTSRGAPRQVREVISGGRRGSITGQYANFGPPADDQPMTSDRIAAILREQRLLNPHLLLLAATSAQGGGTVSLGGRPHRVYLLRDDVAPIRLYVDRRTPAASPA